MDMGFSVLPTHVQIDIVESRLNKRPDTSYDVNFCLIGERKVLSLKES